MVLVIDLSAKAPRLALKQNKKIIDEYSWDGLYQLSESLILKIDNLLKKNKIKLSQLSQIKVIPSQESIVGARIAQATALGLKVKLD